MLDDTIYNVGIYCRISSTSDCEMNNESRSIHYQRELLTEFVTKQGWNIHDTYIDDGYPGTNFERPRFQQMIDDIEDAHINLVIVKDLSRLGRNFLLCGQFIEIYFPNRHVRFIALNDEIDSIHSQNDITPFKNLLNDMYCKDLSMKLRSVHRQKALRGEYLGGNPPLGYLRSPEIRSKLMIDINVAPLIRRIFDLCIAGFGAKAISSILNEEKILTSKDYFRSRKYNPEIGGAFKPIGLWSANVVFDLLKNPIYSGTNVACKVQNISYRSKKHIKNLKENQIIVDNAHEPIITSDQFVLAQECIHNRKIKTYGLAHQPRIFSGLFFCGDCGHPMIMTSDDVDCYKCSQYFRKGKTACTTHYIRANDINQIVLNDIQSTVQLFKQGKQDALFKFKDLQEKDKQKQLSSLESKMDRAVRKKEDLDQNICKTYERNVSGKIPDDRFQALIKTYDEEHVKLNQAISDFREQIQSMSNKSTNLAAFNKLIQKYTNINELNVSMLNELINKITISEAPGEKKKNKIIKIDYKYILVSNNS
jgi:site-specific DNA recombinase